MKGFRQDQTYTVQEFLNTGVVKAVCDTDGHELDSSEKIFVVWKAKPMLLGGRFVLSVKRTEQGIWNTMEKGEMREFGNKHAWDKACERYSPDAPEEQVNAPLHSCLNCRFRRWTGTGFLCAFSE
jgi:hypothetical protein